MTIQAYDRLPENMLGRINDRIKIKGGSDDGPLQTDPAYVDRFVARYLNVLRLDDKFIREIAESRRLGRDVTVTACGECKFKERCFLAFGKVKIEDQEIGLFPFRPGAAFRLLQGMKEDGTAKSAIRKNPRGLLQQIVAPVVGEIAKGIELGTVNMGMPVDPKAPHDLRVAEGRFLGGWDEKSKQRLNYLLWYWTGHENLTQGAGTLDLFREALHLPRFSQTPPPPSSVPKMATEESPPPQAAKPAESPQYVRFLGLLEMWSSSKERLQQDGTFRELVLRLIQNAVPWDEKREPFDPARRRALDASTAAIDIEDMTTRPAVGSALRFEFVRSEQNTGLLRASLRFRFLGSNSWNYLDSISDRRAMGKWVRANTVRIIQRADPVELDPKETHKTAILFLMFAYQLSQKKPLPSEYSDVVNELFSFKPSSPGALSQTLQRIAQDLPLRVEKVREFLIAELNVPQGTGGVLFIDPLPVIRTVAAFDGTLPDFTIDARFGESHWAARFRLILELGNSSWKQLTEALTDELKHLKTVYWQIRSALGDWQPEQETVQDQVESFVEGCKKVKQALTDTKEPIWDDGAKTVLARQENLVSNWRSVLVKVEDIMDTGDLVSLTQFKTEGLVDLKNSVDILMAWVGQLETMVTERYRDETGGRNLDEEIVKAHDSIDLLSQIMQANAEDSDVEA